MGSCLLAPAQGVTLNNCFLCYINHSICWLIVCQDEDDLLENLFWADEVKQKLKEHADEILTLRLIQNEKRALADASANSEESKKDADW